MTVLSLYDRLGPSTRLNVIKVANLGMYRKCNIGRKVKTVALCSTVGTLYATLFCTFLLKVGYSPSRTFSSSFSTSGTLSGPL